MRREKAALTSGHDLACFVRAQSDRRVKTTTPGVLSNWSFFHGVVYG